MRLKRKERLFVIYYLGRAKGNGTLAATLAGYGSNAESSAVLAHRLLRKVKIAAEIEANLNQIAMSEEEVLVRLSERAASSGEDFVTFAQPGNPNALPSLDLVRAKRKGALGNLKKLKVNRRGGDDPLEIVEVEIHDALPALALLMKYHGIGENKSGEGNETANAIRELLSRPRTPQRDS